MSRTLKIEGLTDAQCDALADQAKAAGRKFYDHCRLKLLADVATFQRYEGGKPAQAAPTIKPAFERGSALPSPQLREHPAAPQTGRDLLHEVVEATATPDRIGRLEAMMGQMAETLQLLASNPAQVMPDMPLEPAADNPEIDLEDVIGQSLAVAEREGLTVVEREAPAAASGGVRHVGQRRPAPFSVNSVPQHLRNL